MQSMGTSCTGDLGVVDQHHQQPFGAVDAEDQNFLDVGRAAGAGDEHELATQLGVGGSGAGPPV